MRRRRRAEGRRSPACVALYRGVRGWGERRGEESEWPSRVELLEWWAAIRCRVPPKRGSIIEGKMGRKISSVVWWTDLGAAWPYCRVEWWTDRSVTALSLSAGFFCHDPWIVWPASLFLWVPTRQPDRHRALQNYSFFFAGTLQNYSPCGSRKKRITVMFFFSGLKNVAVKFL